MSLDLFGVFGAGLLTYLTPCVLPLIPIYLSALVGGDIRTMDAGARGQLMVRALLFTLGFISVFTALGLTASAVGGLLVEYKAWLQAAGALLILVFGLKFLGVIRIPLFDRVVRADDTRVQTRAAWLNAVLMGVFFAAGWSPCVGPVLGSVLTYTAAQTSSIWAGAGYLTVYGLGFAVPLLVTAAFAEAAVRLLKKVNPWLPTIEKGVGVLLVVVAVSMGADAMPGLAAGGPGAEDDAAGGSGAVAGAGIAGAGAAGAGVAGSGMAGSGPGVGPGVGQGAGGPAGAEPALPRMIELYSEDCSVCQAMKPTVAGLVAECDGNKVDIELVDVSTPENRHLVRKHRLVGVPTFLFLNERGEEVARLIGHQTEDALKQALSAVRGESCPGVHPLPFGEEDAHILGSYETDATQEIVACPSTNFDVTDAERSSSPSSAHPNGTEKSAAPTAGQAPAACSPGLP